MPATIKMVAAHAGVSVATVSKYINGGNVIKENRVKVQKAIEELDYKINGVARSLKLNKTFTIGVLASSIRSSFVSNIVSNIQNILLEYGYSTIIADYQENKELEKKQLELLLTRLVDGVIFFPQENEADIIEVVRSHNIPLVLVDNLIEECPCDAVLSDNIEGAYAVTEELIKHNHKRIAMVTGTDKMYTFRERLKGYRRACEDYMLEVNENLIVKEDHTIEGGYHAVNRLLSLEEQPTALFIGNYHMALGALKALYEKNVKIPEQLSVVSFDELEFTTIMQPNISTVIQSLDLIAKSAAQRIIQRINGDFSNYPQIDRIKTIKNFTPSIGTIN